MNIYLVLSNHDLHETEESLIEVDVLNGSQIDNDVGDTILLGLVVVVGISIVSEFNHGI